MENKLISIINENNNSFFCLNNDKNENKINSLLNKHIIFELWDKENHTIQTIPGKLLGYKDNYLYIRQYDDGTEDTKKLWTNYDGLDLFKDFEEKIHIDNIRGIEEYKKYNPNLEFKKEFINSICEITNRDNKKIIVLITDFDGFEVFFHYKCMESDNEFIGESSYPLFLIQEIKTIINDTDI